MIAKRPISLGMTIAFAAAVFEKMLTVPGFEKQLEKRFSDISATMLTPEQFDIYWDELFEAITGEKKK